jgi:hypothetical protein
MFYQGGIKFKCGQLTRPGPRLPCQCTRSASERSMSPWVPVRQAAADERSAADGALTNGSRSDTVRNFTSPVYADGGQ